MKHYENHQIENELYEQGYSLIAGTDEVGRGPLAGPVVAAAVIMPKGCMIEGVTDSKKVPEKERYILAEEIKKQAVAYKIMFIDEKKIDEINILEASRLAMTEAINGLSVKPDFCLTDAMQLYIDIPFNAYVKGDEKSFTIACASILAKTARDRYMESLDEFYPEYKFSVHKGYPTKMHMDALKEYGVLPIHRRCYKPVMTEVLKENINKKYE